MNISSINNSQTNFKSGYPVVHWVREAGEKRYAPAVSQELNEKLQRSIIRMLNSDVRKAKPEKASIITKLKQVILRGDRDFASNPVARSFYNIKGGWDKNEFKPFGYILTGLHAEHLSEAFGKPIGIAKSNAPRLGGELADTAEVKISVNDYVYRGLNYVTKLASNFRDNDNIRRVLHTKFEIIRTKTGRIKEIRFEDAKFCPAEGPENPFVRTGYIEQ